jgi:uncharacterized protein (DUF58 family)
MSNSLRIALTLLVFSSLAVLTTNQEIYGRLSYLWLFLITGNYFLSRLALRNLSMRRIPRSLKNQVGEIFEETFQLENKGRLPRIWIEIEDQSTLPGSKGSRVLTLVAGRSTRSYVSRMKLTQRGAYPMGPTIIRSGDPFGFFPVSKHIGSKSDLTVYPRLVNVRTFPSPIGLLPGGDSVRRRTHQITPNASTVREYVAGDPINRIHWASTARRDKLMVKEFELDPLAEVWLFLDGQKRVHGAKQYSLDPDVGQVLLGKRSDNRLAPATEEYMATIAASVSRFFIGQDRALALTISNRFSNDLAPDRGPRQFSKIMEALALMKADGGLAFSAFVLNQARHLTRGSTLVMITPSADEEIAYMVDSVQRLGIRPIVILLNGLSFGKTRSNVELAEKLRATNIPTILINEGEDLRDSLNSQSQANFQTQTRSVIA